MIKSILCFSLFFVGISIELSAQSCLPDTSLPPDVLGVFPMPFDPDANPNGGIRDTACQGDYFEFTFTTVTGDSFSLGENRLALDSLILLKGENGVKGLPSGIEYNCQPGRCAFPKNSLGCVKLSGTATESGVFSLSLNGLLFANGASFGLNLSFPNPLIAPGKYDLLVLPENDAKCKAANIKNQESNQISIPSFFTNEIRVYNEVLVKELSLYQLDGIKVTSVKSGRLDNIAHLSPGVYLLTVELKDGSYQFKKVLKQY